MTTPPPSVYQQNNDLDHLVNQSKQRVDDAHAARRLAQRDRDITLAEIISEATNATPEQAAIYLARISASGDRFVEATNSADNGIINTIQFMLLRHQLRVEEHLIGVGENLRRLEAKIDALGSTK